jgi:hypothetical protein
VKKIYRTEIKRVLELGMNEWMAIKKAKEGVAG